MTETEHEAIHLRTDIRNYLKLIVKNKNKYPHPIGHNAELLLERMDKQDKIKGEVNE